MCPLPWLRRRRVALPIKVLWITPYSPLLHHDHGANDLALPLIQTLAPYLELHVYAPGQQNGSLVSWHNDGVTYHAGSLVHQTRLDRVGRYPYAARESWSRQSTRETVALVRELHPDILHGEYFQAVEPLLRCAQQVPVSITMHDVIEASVTTGTAISSRRYWLERIERAKTQRTMSAVLAKMDALLVFSERDRRRVACARGIAEVTPVGIDLPSPGWLRDRPHVAVFGGAMWRRENEVSASYLAREVMPLVRQAIPDAELRIFGARPTSTVRALGDHAGVTVVGEVADYDDEFRRAAVTLAPMTVGGGLLLKAIRAMAIGCPVVLNSASAGPIAGLVPGVHAHVGDSPHEFAAHVVGTMQDKDRASQMGQAAMDLVRAQFNSDRTAEVYRRVFEQIIQV